MHGRRIAAPTCLAWLLVAGALSAEAPPAPSPADLAARATAVLRTHCYRCHGQDGAVEGGLNYLLDRDRLVARRKLVPGAPERSPLYLRTARGKMPPPGETPRPTSAEIAVLRRWIEAGAPGSVSAPERRLVTERTGLEWMRADLDRADRRARRFRRYFSLIPLANAGAGADELSTYRNALAKLINSLSWHPRITAPVPVDPHGLLLRIDLRDYLLDATSWNRLLADYPYGILHDTGVGRAVLVATGTRMPVVRADWFVATASRAPLYYDLLQMPTNLGELERQLRVDAALNLQQDRVARAGFNGSGISRNNRLLERHDAMNGAYWRSYDFEAVPQNLLERNLLVPDRRNLFAYPLGPGGAETNFRHAGGEVIFHLPNGLHGYMLVNARNERINKGPTDIVSDPKRPDRAVEAGLSCMNCHATGILQKDDQIREHVKKNARAFSAADRELIEALHPPAARLRALMEEDSHRFQAAVARTGNRTTAAEVIMTMTLRFEADVDLPTLAAELGVAPPSLMPHLGATETLARNLGALRLPGGTVSRQVEIASFGELVRAVRLGTPMETGRGGESLPDATADVDPLEAQSSPANALAFSPDGRLAALACNDRSVRLFDLVGNRDLRRCIGHTASVWCVAFSPDGTRLLSGGKDGTVRLWEVESGRELLKIEAHRDLVSAVAFAPDGKSALSAGFDRAVQRWDLDRGARLDRFAFDTGGRHVQALASAADGKTAFVACQDRVCQVDTATGKEVRRFEGHTDWVAQVAISRDGKFLATAGDDGVIQVWQIATGTKAATLTGHTGAVRAVALSGDGRTVVSGGSDATVRLWDVPGQRQLRVFTRHADALVGVTFLAGQRYTLSGSRDGIVETWKLPR